MLCKHLVLGNDLKTDLDCLHSEAWLIFIKYFKISDLKPNYNLLIVM